MPPPLYSVPNRPNCPSGLRNIQERYAARVYHRFAILLRRKGRTAAAEACQWRSVLHNINHLGADHQETVFGMLSLAVVLYRRGRHQCAKRFASRAVVRIEQLCGPLHWRTLMAKHNLAVVCAVSGEWNDARTLMSGVLIGNRATLKHPYGAVRYLASVICLARILHQSGDYSQAARLYEEAVNFMNEHEIRSVRTKEACIGMLSMAQERKSPGSWTD